MTATCPKCHGAVGHWDAYEDAFCINCGWREHQPIVELQLTRDVRTPVKRPPGGARRAARAREGTHR